jgi:hypothetical protein
MVVVNDNQRSSVTIDAFPSGGGNVEQQDMTMGGIVNVDIGTNLLFTGIASNPGGVKLFSIDVLQNGGTLYSAKIPNTPNSSNKVPNPVRILGTNGSGGAGNQSMIVNNLTSPVQVVTSASNFGSSSNSFSIIYAPVDPNQRGKDKQTKITLHRQIATNLYTGDFPSTPFSGTITGISNPGSMELIFLRKGQSASNCSNNNNPSAWVIIGVGNQANPPDLDALFGPSHALPVTFMACSNPAINNPPETIDVLVSYHVN